MDPLRISIVGLSRWESVFVETSVDLASGMELPPCQIVEDPKAADVLLVDANHRRYVALDDIDKADQPVVVSFTEHPDSTDGIRGLQRPVGYADLIATLKDIEHQLHEPAVNPPPPEPARPKQAEPVAAKPVRKASNPAATRALLEYSGRSTETLSDKARPARRFVEGTRLLGTLNRISRWGIAAEVSHAEYPTLLVSPAHNTFVASDDPLSHPRMFRDSVVSFAIRDLADDIAEAVLTSGKLRPLSHLIYCAALFGSEGRLILNRNPRDRLSLIGTPDFDAVPHVPEHKTIARYLIANAADLADISRSTGVSIGVVIDFCNACEAIGLLRRIPETGDDQEVDEHGVLHVFGRVRDMFRDS